MRALVNNGVCGAQALRQHPHHIEREVRGAADQEQKLLLADRNDGRVGRRYRGRAARTMVDQRHFAENAELRQGIEQPVAEPDFHLAALDDVQFLGRIALAENDLAGFEGADRAPAPAKMPKSTAKSAISLSPKLNKIISVS